MQNTEVAEAEREAGSQNLQVREKNDVRIGVRAVRPASEREVNQRCRYPTGGHRSRSLAATRN